MLNDRYDEQLASKYHGLSRPRYKLLAVNGKMGKLLSLESPAGFLGSGLSSFLKKSILEAAFFLFFPFFFFFFLFSP